MLRISQTGSEWGSNVVICFTLRTLVVHADRMVSAFGWNEVRLRVSRAVSGTGYVLGIELEGFAPSLDYGCFVKSITPVAHQSVRVRLMCPLLLNALEQHLPSCAFVAVSVCQLSQCPLFLSYSGQLMCKPQLLTVGP